MHHFLFLSAPTIYIIFQKNSIATTIHQLTLSDIYNIVEIHQLTLKIHQFILKFFLPSPPPFKNHALILFENEWNQGFFIEINVKNGVFTYIM